MYVEISPRQTGKTTRLLDALVEYSISFFVLRQRFPIIGLMSYNQNVVHNLKETLKAKITLQRFFDPINHPDGEQQKIRFMESVVTGLSYEDVIDNLSRKFHGYIEPDYWFVDEFALIPRELVFPNSEPMENGYYVTTPNSKRGRFRIRVGSVYYLADYCVENNIEIHFHNTWTEARLREQLIFAEYVKEHILEDWVDFMEYYDFKPDEIKEKWIYKSLKKHKFLC